jgi:serine/threonine-protein kinase PpkA
MSTKSRIRHLGLAATFGLLLGIAASVFAQRAPLPQSPGDDLLFQRVLTRHGAELSSSPDGPSKGRVDTFSRLYVYGRDMAAGKTWLEVGSDSRGTIAGWIPEADTVPWRQQLCVVFADRTHRERMLVFENQTDLRDLLRRSRPYDLVRDLLADEAKRRADPRIVGIEPESVPDMDSHFYLLPILEHREVSAKGGEPARLLRVMAVTDPATRSDSDRDVIKLRNFRSVVVFVIDTTESMGPYIEAMKRAVAGIQRGISSDDSDVSFGLVEYRGDAARVPGLGFASRYPLKPGGSDNLGRFQAALDRLYEAPVSSGDHFTEDALLGLERAIRESPWGDFDGRHLVLVTDAASFEGDRSLTSLDLAWAADQARRQDIALYTLHLQTPDGQANHARAKKQYERLSSPSGTGSPLYFVLALGGAGYVGSVVDGLARTIVEDTAKGVSTKPSPPSAPSPSSDPVKRRLEHIKYLASWVGYAQRLAYYQRKGESAPPLDFQGWVVDRDLKDPGIPALDVRVLLTRNQLSDIAAITDDIVNSGLSGKRPAPDFFGNLQQLAVDYSWDPNRLAWSGVDRFDEHALLNRYLDDLPYRSEVLKVSSSIWSRWDRHQQMDFIGRLQFKLNRYRLLLANPDIWIALAKGAPVDEQVYPIRLDALP